MTDTQETLTRIEAKLDRVLAEIESFKASAAGFMGGPGKTLLRAFGKVS